MTLREYLAKSRQPIQHPGSRGGHPHWTGTEWVYGEQPTGGLEVHPETRLIHALHDYGRSTVSNERLLKLCRDAWDVPIRGRRAPGATRRPPNDEGWLIYRDIVKVLTKRYSTREHWPIPAVIGAITNRRVSQ